MLKILSFFVVFKYSTVITQDGHSLLVLIVGGCSIQGETKMHHSNLHARWLENCCVTSA